MQTCPAELFGQLVELMLTQGEGVVSLREEVCVQPGPKQTLAALELSGVPPVAALKQL